MRDGNSRSQAVALNAQQVSFELPEVAGVGAGNRQSTVPSLLAELEKLDPDLLRKRWHSIMRTSAPRSLSRSLLIRILAWREQVKATGDLDRKLLLTIEEAIGQKAGIQSKSVSRGPGQLRPGMVLVREHGGTNHRVAVLADGFSWNGEIFDSLSAVARAITGVNWNGPRFFGLERPALNRAVRSNRRNDKTKERSSTKKVQADRKKELSS